ncbi:MAG: VPLPA-CTERM sorting domain-containing protein [Neptuniibacter sp.]
MLLKMRNLLSCMAATLVLASPVSNAALLDFTDLDVLDALSKSGSGTSTTYSGLIDNVAFTLSATGGTLKKHNDSKYDGSSYIGCQATGGPLKCDKDGLGVDNDEITGYSDQAAKEKIIISFAKPVSISDFYFLDLYKGSQQETAKVTINGLTYGLNASATSGDGGFGGLSLLTPLITDQIVFAAPFKIGDDGNNDFAVAGLSLTPVPLPAAAWLFVSGLAGVAWLRRRKITAA